MENNAAAKVSKDNMASMILHLDDDCLETICRQLDVKDQINYSRACFRLRDAFRRTAKFQYKSLRLNDLKSLNLSETRYFFKNAGPYIEQVTCYTQSRNYNHNYVQMLDYICRYSPRVKAVSLHMSKLNVKILRRMGKSLSNVTEVELYNFALTNRSILALKDWSKLERLNLSENANITGRHISKLTQVKQLNLLNCHNITPAHFKRIFECLTELRELDIRCCELVDSAVFEAMNQYCHKLEMLQIACPDEPYDAVARLPMLKRLEFFVNPTLTAVPELLLESLAEDKAEQLDCLKILSKDFITIDHAKMISRLKQLRSLICPNSTFLNDACLHQFGKLGNLEEIVLNNCIQITDEGLLHLMQECRQLKTINVQYCTNLSGAFVFDVVKFLKERQEHPKVPVSIWVFKTNIRRSIVQCETIARAKNYIQLFFGMLYPSADYEHLDVADTEYDDSDSEYRDVFDNIYGDDAYDNFFH